MPPYLFVENDFPPHVTAWSLENRTQFVKLGNCSSASMKLGAGCPQGTLSGPNNFKLLINDLCFANSCIKYVDDVSLISVSVEPDNNLLQLALNDLLIWCETNSMKINFVKLLGVYFNYKFTLKHPVDYMLKK